MDQFTQDTFFAGQIKIIQSRNGYRFSIDAPLLAAIVTPKAGDTIMDLGTGCGIIALLVSTRFPNTHVTAIEVQPELTDLARKNVDNNGLADNINVIHADMRELPLRTVRGPFDWVVTNPPYHGAQTGRINPNPQRALARHEIMIDLAQLLASARKMLRTGGYFATIYTADRAVELFVQMRASGIEPKWIQWVHGKADEAAKLLLVKGVKAGRPGVQIAAPLVVYDNNGQYTPAVQAMLQGSCK